MQERHIYAQTNIQLYNQLCEIGFSGGELEKMRMAYDLAASLFADKHRASGKPFTSHLVGTASILAAYGATAPVVIAGLLHAAYEQGGFSSFGKNSPAAGKVTVHQFIDEDVEVVITRYTALQWNAEAIQTMLEGTPELLDKNRDVLMIRLANELEDCLDYGLLYCSAQRREDGMREVTKCIKLAHALRQPELAEEFNIAFARARDTDVPPSLAGRRDRSYSLRLSSGKSGP